MFEFEKCLLAINPYLKRNNCTFGYQQKCIKKHGHCKLRIKNGIKLYEIKIEKNDNDAGKVYTLIHEFAHFYNSHLENKDLTRPQKEYVAHYVAMGIIDYLRLKKELTESAINKKFHIDSYGKMWMKDRRLTIKQKEIMINQEKNTIKYLKKHIFNIYIV